MSGVFVAGTDTGVGKTRAAVALLHALRCRHARVVGMKPVAAGAILQDGTWVSEDALALRCASSFEAPAELYNPVLLREPMSPHLAARREGVRIDIEHIVHCYAQLSKSADAVVVEGAGGFLVPLSDSETGANLAQALGLPIVLVVGLRLGCLNHALLTAEAIRSRGLPLIGWICNRIDAAMLAPEDNIAYLRTQLSVPLLADIGFNTTWDPHADALQLPPDWP